jgi:hypothetical protein
MPAFSLDADNAFGFGAEPEPPPLLPVEPSPEQTMSDSAVARAFSLDKDTPGEEVQDAVFLLDADSSRGPAVPIPKADVPASPPVAAEEEFSLVNEQEAEEPAPPPQPVVVEKPAEGRRPALKITFVTPGTKSPFAK